MYLEQNLVHKSPQVMCGAVLHPPQVRTLLALSAQVTSSSTRLPLGLMLLEIPCRHDAPPKTMNENVSNWIKISH